MLQLGDKSRPPALHPALEPNAAVTVRKVRLTEGAPRVQATARPAPATAPQAQGTAPPALATHLRARGTVPPALATHPPAPATVRPARGTAPPAPATHPPAQATPRPAQVRQLLLMPANVSDISCHHACPRSMLVGSIAPGRIGLGAGGEAEMPDVRISRVQSQAGARSMHVLL